MLPLPAALTQNEASRCSAELRQQIRAWPQPVVTLDARALLRFDSAALAVLLECRRECAAAGKTFAVQGMATRLLALAQLYGVAELLPAAS